MNTLHPTPLDPPLAISYKNHRKSLVHFSCLALLILFFLLKGIVKRGSHGTISDGHDKPFCTKAITIIDNFKKPWAILIIDKSQFLKAISIIDKLSPINFSDKCCGEFLMCLTKFFL